MLNYKLIAYQIEVGDSRYWVAEFPAIKDMFGKARGMMDAVGNLQVNAALHLAIMKMNGHERPEEDALCEN